MTELLPEKILNKIQPEPMSGCWLWIGAASGRRNHKYGTLVERNKNWQAHRYVYTRLVGDPGDMNCCHSCDNPRCVNPSHIFLGTQKDNMIDAKIKGRVSGKSLSRCVRGHEFLPGSYRVRKRKDGRLVRVCLACNKIRIKAFKINHPHYDRDRWRSLNSFQNG